ncbi:MAG TPA: hypothetical protein VJ553_05305 [Candidatus Paceibacterota bacterium]|nr:hypothetical protein [Candidatus Paceibacterota bacterium]
MSKAAEFILTWLGYFAGALFLVFLIAATAYGLLRAYDRRKEENRSHGTEPPARGKAS